MLNMDNIHWFCSACNSGIGRMLPTLMKLEMRQNKLEETVTSHNTKLAEDMNKLKMELNKHVIEMKEEIKLLKVDTEVLNKQFKAETEIVDKKMKQNVEEHVVEFRDIVKQQIQDEMHNVDGELTEVKKTIQDTREQADEQRDKENRRNNIILYNVPESDLPRAEERSKVDMDFCLLLFNRCLNAGVAEEDIVKVFRLGKRSERARPVLLQLASYTQKNLIMESLYKLKNAEIKFKQVIIVHDMTKAERQECKKMVDEAKSRTDADPSGEFQYKVRGMPGHMRIVKLKARNQIMRNYVQQI